MEPVRLKLFLFFLFLKQRRNKKEIEKSIFAKFKQ